MIGRATITNRDFGSGIRNGNDNNFILVTGAGSTFNNVSGSPFSLGGQYITFAPIDAFASGNYLDAVNPPG